MHPLSTLLSRHLCAALFSGALALSQTIAVSAQTAVPTPVTPIPATVGSSNPVSAEPLVPRPSTKPCVVSLFTNQLFDNFNNTNFSYTPPAGCPGPWSKVVFAANYNVTAGNQFDRTSEIFLGGAIVYFGTTAEPRSNLSPSWHVERDVTNLSALLKSTQPGVATLGNFYGVDDGVDYNGSITGSAELDFYPANFVNPAPKEPDTVLPLNTVGETTALNTTTDRLTGTFPGLPENIEGAYLQLYSESQATDEFWYTCSPNSVAAALDNNCGNSAFRETEVYIDGTAAGIAPVYPWIYTGGIDPFLWEPITGVQTLDFKPYLVDLTPFAGLLSNGQQHTVAIGVYNADSSFQVTGTLLLYLDHGSKRVTGAVTANTLGAAPEPNIVAPTPTTANSITTGSTLVTSLRAFHLAGYVNTSHGRVETTLDETVNFGNAQTIAFNPTSGYYKQDITQLSGAYSVTKQQAGLIVTSSTKSSVYPFSFSYDYTPNADGSYSQSSNSNQQDQEAEQDTLFGLPLFHSSATEQVTSGDAYAVNAAGALASQSSSSQGKYQSQDSLGACYSRTLESANLKLTKVTDGDGCRAGVNHP